MKKESSIMKKAGMALALALAVVLSTGLVACGGKSNEEIIREGVTSEFESIKNMDDQAFNDVLEGFTSSADLSEFGVDNTEFIKNWLTGFDYSVDDVKVDGNNATVTVTVTVKSLTEAMSQWQTDVTELAASEEAQNMTQEELYAELGTMLMQCVTDAPMSTTTIELPYTLNGNTWEPAAGFDAALGEAFVGGSL